MKIEKIEITVNEMIFKAENWLKTSDFQINQGESTITVKPISLCQVLLPVNAVATSVLGGFIRHLFQQASLEATLCEIEEKMKKPETNGEIK
ncbi:MAG: hypothetical protein AAB787_01675 [Patescibacteria group bacterium]